MSIPGLGLIPVQAPSATRTHKLPFLSEWRFVVSQPPIKVRLLSGTAERDGTELAANQTYSFAGMQTKLFSWSGCELEIEGVCDSERVVPPPSPAMDSDGVSPVAVVAYMNVHMLLSTMRQAVSLAHAYLPGRSSNKPGPRVLVCGPAHVGRTSLVRMLAAWASKTGEQPCVVNTDPQDGMLSLPGTLSAAVFATLMDIESEGGDGWGASPVSGPSAVPVKLPIVFNFGYGKPRDAPVHYERLVSCLAHPVSARMSEDPAVQAGGLLIDTPACSISSDDVDAAITVDQLAHTIQEFSVNYVVVLGSTSNSQQLYDQLSNRFRNYTTTYNEQIQIVQLESSDGIVHRSENMLQQLHEATIKEYFFGDSKRPLSPYTQQVDSDSLTIYRLPDGMRVVDITPALTHWTLAVMNAGLHDPPEAIERANVLGFVYVADVDADRGKMRVLSPVSGRVGDRPLVLGRWPEPFINLLG